MCINKIILYIHIRECYILVFNLFHLAVGWYQYGPEVYISSREVLFVHKELDTPNDI